MDSSCCLKSCLSHACSRVVMRSTRPADSSDRVASCSSNAQRVTDHLAVGVTLSP